jgi:hypothetical protein
MHPHAPPAVAQPAQGGGSSFSSSSSSWMSVACFFKKVGPDPDHMVTHHISIFLGAS